MTYVFERDTQFFSGGFFAFSRYPTQNIQSQWTQKQQKSENSTEIHLFQHSIMATICMKQWLAALGGQLHQEGVKNIVEQFWLIHIAGVTSVWNDSNL